MSFRLAFATAFTATAGGHAGSVAGSRHVAGRIIGAYRIGVSHVGRCGSVGQGLMIAWLGAVFLVVGFVLLLKAFGLVKRSREQSPQNGSVTELMNPMAPPPSRNRNRVAGA